MPLSENIKDRERDKFTLNQENLTAIRTVSEIKGGTLLTGIEYDTIEATYPTATLESYAYKLGSDLKATILITYSDSTKETLLSVVRL